MGAHSAQLTVGAQYLKFPNKTDLLVFRMRLKGMGDSRLPFKLLFEKKISGMKGSVIGSGDVNNQRE